MSAKRKQPTPLEADIQALRNRAHNAVPDDREDCIEAYDNVLDLLAASRPAPAPGLREHLLKHVPCGDVIGALCECGWKADLSPTTPDLETQWAMHVCAALTAPVPPQPTQCESESAIKKLFRVAAACEAGGHTQRAKMFRAVANEIAYEARAAAPAVEGTVMCACDPGENQTCDICSKAVEDTPREIPCSVDGCPEYRITPLYCHKHQFQGEDATPRTPLHDAAERVPDPENNGYCSGCMGEPDLIDTGKAHVWKHKPYCWYAKLRAALAASTKENK